MHQLSGLDNLMIQGELPNLPMHMSAVMIYRTKGKEGTDRFFDTFRERFGGVVEEHFPILHCRLENIPLQLDRAYWVEDRHFSPTYHVNRVALPKPQDWQTLYQLFGQFHAQPLNQARPLWEVLCVEGLDHLEGIPRGSAALFMKIHHAVMDGKSAQRLMSSLHNLSPEPGAALVAEAMPDENPMDTDFQAPSWLARYGRAWWHNIERPVDLAVTLAKLVPQLMQGNGTDKAEEATPTPHVRFNHPVAPDRIVGHVRMSLALLRKLEKQQGCTINDIALCVIAGALRHYLLQKGELPEYNLKALMPIDVRREGKDGSIGNQVSVAKIPLYTLYDDPRQRLEAIHVDTRQGKKRTRKANSHAMLRLADDVHPALILWLGRWLVSSGHIDELPQAVNTVVTNVPGSPQKTYIGKAQLIDYLGFGPLAPNMGLFHTVSSTTDHVNISFLSTAELVDDGSEYRESIARSWEEVSSLLA